MPYDLRKQPLHDKYWVVNKETGKKYSYEPLDKETAMKQLRALYVAEGGEVPKIRHTKKKQPKRTRFEKGSQEARDKMASVRAGKQKMGEGTDSK